MNDDQQLRDAMDGIMGWQGGVAHHPANEFARTDAVVGFMDTGDIDGVKIGSDYARKILALEFYFKGERHTIWIGLESGTTVIERDRDEAEIFRGNLNETHRSTYRGRNGTGQDDQRSST